MRQTSRRMIAAAVGALSLGAGALWADSTERQARIQQLEGKIAALEARQAADSKATAATIDALLRDAEKRSQLLANSGDMSAGYDQGFFIAAGDSFVLRPSAELQFRHIANWREEVTASGENDWEEGFELRRVRLELAGVVISKDLQYFFQWDTRRGTGDMFLQEAWTRYMFADDWGTRLGQFKSPVGHEFLIGGKRDLAVDISMADAAIGGGRAGYTQAATLIYGGYAKNNPLNVEVGLSDGARQANTSFVDQDYNFGVVGRAEYKLMGDWVSYRDFTALGTKERLFVVGLGGDWSQSGAADEVIGILDAQYESPQGYGMFAALIARYRNEEAAGDDQSDWGGVVQASYLLTGNWEIFARYDGIWFDQDVFEDEDTFHEITAGLNYYFGKGGSAAHRAKVTFDVSYLPDGAPAAFPNLGIIDANNGNDEWIIRTQFQLLI